MYTPESNPEAYLAEQYLLHTSRSVFLTGRAGTGKTTFLKHLKEHSPRKMAVAAPTGIAAINAGGVTLHSLFQLPFGTYLPNIWPLPEGAFYNRDMLFSNTKLGADKRRLLNELDTLVVDEVSMLRCDLLDALDTLLRSIRKNQRPFGNLQLLFIGDLQQLPPVVQDDEWKYLSQAYETPFFFSAKSYQQLDPVYIELKMIYRQKESVFIELLEKIRNGNPQPADIALLNNRFSDQQMVEEGVVTLTTHNHKAEKINRAFLEQLPGKEMVYSGVLKGDFNERNLPAESELILKEKAQVMFVKNDSSGEKKYYNGKMATVSAIKENSIEVITNEEGEKINVNRETWTNIRYKHNQEEDMVEEEETGSYSQFPLKLAWAITIHKSQGLTFDKVRIDAAEAFAGGQVYVALSRCRTLEGIQLTTPINGQAILTDARLNSPWLREQDKEVLSDQLLEAKREFARWQLTQAFRFEKELTFFKTFLDFLEEKKFSDKDATRETLLLVEKRLGETVQTGNKFILQLENFFRENPSDSEWLKDRAGKGIAWFANHLHNEVVKPVEALHQLLKPKKGVKQLVSRLAAVEERFWVKLNQLQKISYGDFDFSAYHAVIERKTVSAKSTKLKGETYLVTLDLFEEGKSLQEIAELREMSVSTIEGHLARWVNEGKIPLEKLVTSDDFKMIEKAIGKMPDASITELKNALVDKFSYVQIRLVKERLADIV